MKKLLILFLPLLFVGVVYAQTGTKDSVQAYKKRVLENIEIDLLGSYYTQTGENAATSGGIGSEELQDLAPSIIVSIPLNDDDVLTIDGNVSAYTSASSSNINPFDGREGVADPFVQSSGASKSDTWVNGTANYSHSSDDRNKIWSAKFSFSNEYDYTSIGFGGSFTKLFNEKNTELSINANVFLDTWKLLYPIELRTTGRKSDDDENFVLQNNTIPGNANYNPKFSPLNDKSRNSFSMGFSLSQILSERMQASFLLDLTYQSGLLSTPFHRIYFKDFEDSFIENFQLADDIERLPNARFKIAAGGRLNYYINEFLVLRTYYRYYTDDWGINSHTASIELPIKIGDKFTLYPSYRFYNQTSVDYFAPYEQHLSTSEFYTSDYDLSEYAANQFGFGITYTDIFTSMRVYKLGLKSIGLKYNYYERDSGLKANVVALNLSFVLD